MNRTEWAAAHAGKIGSGDAAALMGCSPYSSPLSVYRRLLRGEGYTEEMTEWQRMGVELEPFIVRQFALGCDEVEDAWMHTGVVMVHPEHPWAICTPDAFWIDKAADENFPVDAKLCRNSERTEDGLPLDWRCQLNWQLFVLGVDKAAVAALVFGKGLEWAIIDRDDALIQAMVDRALDLREAVISGTPPPWAIDGSKATSEALKDLYPQHEPGKSIVLPGEMIDVAAELQAWKNLRKEADAKISERENALKAAIGDAEEATLPNGWTYTFKASPRKGYTVEPTTVRTLRRKGGDD